MSEIFSTDKPALMPAASEAGSMSKAPLSKADWLAQRQRPTLAFIPCELKSQTAQIAAECEMPEDMALAIAGALGRGEASTFRGLAKAAGVPLMAVFAFAHIRHFLDFGAQYLFPPVGARSVCYTNKADVKTIVERARTKGLFSGAADLEILSKYYVPALFAGKCPDLPPKQGCKSA